jgi:hypothetical protein
MRESAVTDEWMRLVFDAHAGRQGCPGAAQRRLQGLHRSWLGPEDVRIYLFALSFLDSSRPVSIWVNSPYCWFGWCWRLSRGQTRGGCERETLDDFFVKLETDG